MNMNKFYKILSIAELALFAVATIFVIVFQITGHTLFVTMSLVVYSVGFLVVMTMYVFKAIEIFEKEKTLKSNIKEADKENKLKETAKAKIIEIVKASLAGVFAIFTFIVLILY